MQSESPNLSRLRYGKTPRSRSLPVSGQGDPDVAEDALQEAYWAVAEIEHVERIEDLRKCF
jgi:hypothetical protein